MNLAPQDSYERSFYRDSAAIHGGTGFSLERLNQVRGLVLGAGGLQVGLTIGVVALGALVFDVPPERAVFLSFLVSLRKIERDGQ